MGDCCFFKCVKVACATVDCKEGTRHRVRGCGGKNQYADSPCILRRGKKTQCWNAIEQARPRPSSSPASMVCKAGGRRWRSGRLAARACFLAVLLWNNPLYDRKGRNKIKGAAVCLTAGMAPAVKTLQQDRGI